MAGTKEEDAAAAFLAAALQRALAAAPLAAHLLARRVCPLCVLRFCGVPPSSPLYAQPAPAPAALLRAAAAAAAALAAAPPPSAPPSDGADAPAPVPSALASPPPPPPCDGAECPSCWGALQHLDDAPLPLTADADEAPPPSGPLGFALSGGISASSVAAALLSDGHARQPFALRLTLPPGLAAVAAVQAAALSLPPLRPADSTQPRTFVTPLGAAVLSALRPRVAALIGFPADAASPLSLSIEAATRDPLVSAAALARLDVSQRPAQGAQPAACGGRKRRWGGGGGGGGGRGGGGGGGGGGVTHEEAYGCAARDAGAVPPTDALAAWGGDAFAALVVPQQRRGRTTHNTPPTPHEGAAALSPPPPPPPPRRSLLVGVARPRRAPLLIGGYYTKHLRGICQSPWLVATPAAGGSGGGGGDDDDEGGGGFTSVGDGRSVQEELEHALCGLVVVCDASKLLSAGREDMDVRMLGGGRPFLLEYDNARCAPQSLTHAAFRDVEAALAAGGRVGARCLLARPSGCSSPPARRRRRSATGPS